MGYLDKIRADIEKSKAKAEKAYGPQEKGDVAGRNIISDQCMTELAKSLSVQNSAINNMLAQDEKLQDLCNGYGSYCESKTAHGVTKIVQEPPMEVVVRKEKGRTKEVTSLCYFTFGDSVDFDLLHPNGRFKITGFDRRVYNAVGTLWNIGQKTFSMTEIFDVMNGRKKSHPTEHQLDAIWRSIYKMEQVIVYVDLSNEFKEHMIKDKQPLIDAGILKNSSDDVKKVEIKDRMLHVQGSIVTSVQGKRTARVHLVNEPVLCAYNRSKNSIINVPLEFIGLEEISTTEKTVAFQDYLVIRVLSYINGVMNENKIKYDSIYQFSGIEKPENRNAQLRDRNTIKAIMQEWVNKGLIESFAEIKSGRSCIGIQFEVNKKNKTIENKQNKTAVKSA